VGNTHRLFNDLCACLQCFAFSFHSMSPLSSISFDEVAILFSVRYICSKVFTFICVYYRIVASLVLFNEGRIVCAVIVLLMSDHVYNALAVTVYDLLPCLVDFVIHLIRCTAFYSVIWALDIQICILSWIEDENVDLLFLYNIFISVLCQFMWTLLGYRVPPSLRLLGSCFCYVKDPDLEKTCPVMPSSKEVRRERKRHSNSVGGKHFNTKKSRLADALCLGCETDPIAKLNVEPIVNDVYEQMRAKCRCTHGTGRSGGCFLSDDPDPTIASNTVKRCHKLLSDHSDKEDVRQAHLVNLFRMTIDWTLSNKDRLFHHFDVVCGDRTVKLCRNVWALLHGMRPSKFCALAQINREIDGK
jgi:hypothetical protein